MKKVIGKILLEMIFVLPLVLYQAMNFSSLVKIQFMGQVPNPFIKIIKYFCQFNDRVKKLCYTKFNGHLMTNLNR